MISHKHKCIFIHITKCAGSSIETAFGIDTKDNSQKFNDMLFGWYEPAYLYLQHATPQTLFDNNLISKKIWDDYYKFVIVRNPWERMLSDYIWFYTRNNIKASFSEYINKAGLFKKILTDNTTPEYRGDHLFKQKDYFFINGRPIEYDLVIRMENIYQGLNQVIRDLSLPHDFFDQKTQVSDIKKVHYSIFYNKKRKRLVDISYKEDIEFLNYQFERTAQSYFSIIKHLSSDKFIEHFRIHK